MELEKIYQGDPLAKLLIEKWHLTPIRLVIITILIPLIVFYVFALVSDTWRSSSNQLGLSQDLSIWYSTVINAITYGYYLWISGGEILNLFNNLEKSGAVKISQEDRNLIFSAYRKPWRKLLSLIISVIGNVQLFVLMSSVDKTGFNDGWINSSSWLSLRLTHAFLSFIGSYMIWMLVFGFFLNIWLIQKILESKVLKLNPFYPDRCGGMVALSDYSLKTAYLSVLYAVMIGLFAYQQITQNLSYKGFSAYFGIPVYILISLFCFFAPLLTAHERMKAAKNEALKIIAIQFQDDYAQAQNGLNENAESIKKRIEKMQELKSFCKLTDEFPTWPFDTRNLRQYMLTIVTPLIPPLVGVLQKLGAEFLKDLGILL